MCNYVVKRCNRTTQYLCNASYCVAYCIRRLYKKKNFSLRRTTTTDCHHPPANKESANNTTNQLHPHPQGHAMVLDHQAAANHLTVNDEESHLLKLPPEIRNRIFELALAHDYTVRIEPDWKEPRPSLLHVCRQIRAETRLVYQHLRKFYICANACNIDKVRRWVALITDEELRSIQDLTLQYQESVRDRSLDHVSHVEQRE